jgi:hypothetical protein
VIFVGVYGIRPIAHTDWVNNRANAIRPYGTHNMEAAMNNVPVWQRNYHEHIIRDDADYNRIAEYVAYNPQRWVEDKLHPDNFVDVENVVQKTVMGGDGNIVGAYGHTPGSRCENPKSGVWPYAPTERAT